MSEALWVAAAIGFSKRQADGDEKTCMQAQSSDMEKGEVERLLHTQKGLRRRADDVFKSLFERCGKKQEYWASK